MNNENSPDTLESQTDFEWLDNATDDDIDLSDDPEPTPEMWKNGIVRKGGIFGKRSKRRISMYLDADIIAHFKDKAEGSGYQTLINQALRASIEAEDLEHMLRQVIREEMVAYETAVASSTDDSD